MNHTSKTTRMLAPAVGLACAFALIAARPDVGMAQTVPGPPTGYDQIDPDMGSGLVAWSEDRGAGHRIYGKRLRSNGIPVGGPSSGDFYLTRPTGLGGDADSTGDQRFPALGGPGLVWSERVDDVTGYDLFAQRLHANGLPSGPPRLLLSAPGDQLFADVISTASGYFVVYSEDTNDEGDVMGLRFTSALVPRGVPFPLAQGEGAASDPTIVRDPLEPDRLLVYFTFLPKDGDNSDIYGVRVSETGLPLGGPLGGVFPVVATPENEYAPFLLTGTFADSFRRGGDNQTSNLFLFVRDDATDGADVYAQRLRANGLVVGSALKIAGGIGTQSWPTADIISDENREDEWQLGWADDAAGTYDIVGQRLRFNGIPRARAYPLVGD